MRGALGLKADFVSKLTEKRKKNPAVVMKVSPMMTG